ncbi:glycosyltransferase [Sinorhizobium phage phiM9]|uniref:Putative GT1 glycosyltransferase protein n=1 Tax=Sinorhizobium phage phiM9 TaxID=1636182 RepID=A0A0F6R7P3_9CAUD|nr:glycosyltransferase [Sinorhizobium phage phiM9]AKE44828.1 putative GT1 glycosyltransferase protein [Sinorhizobium phage phiM9]
MKIAILTSHFTPTLADHTRITNGLDAIVVKAIPVLKKQGHEVHVICAGKVDGYWWTEVLFHSLVEKTVEELEGKSVRMALTREYYKKIHAKLREIKPDLVWSHLPSPGTSAEIALDWPTIHHVHEVNQNAMYAVGRLAGLSKMIENGGTVYNSYFAERTQRKIAEGFMKRTNDTKNMHLLEKPITSVYQVVNTPLDTRFLEGDLVKPDFLPFMIGRYDPKFTGKNIHLIDKLGIPIYAAVSGNHPKIFKQLEFSNTTRAYFNSPREDTIRLMKKSEAHIMAYLYESTPVANYELMCCGSVPITIGLSETEPNAGYILAKRILGDLVPECVPIDAPDLKERLERNIMLVMNGNDAARKHVAETARKALSHEAWYQEFMSLIPNGRKTQVTPLDV